LRIVGRADDGVIEALEAPDRRFLITVQWHPEEIASLPWARQLFRGFVRAAAAS
jgi:putative glutamine amidotransferase